jgi:hypothetical protein
MMKKAAA